MKKTIYFIICLLTNIACSSQSYLGWVTKQSTLREGPGKEFKILSSLKAGTQMFIISIEADNDFYNVIYIKTNKEGYVHKSLIKLGKEILKNDQGMFNPTGETSTNNTEVEIYNNTHLTLTLKLNNVSYTFSPKEKRTVTLTPDAYDYRASAPGVIPNIGTEVLESKMGYSWQFYIITKQVKN